MLQDVQNGLAGKPPSVPRSATAVGAFAAGGAPGDLRSAEAVVGGRRHRARPQLMRAPLQGLLLRLMRRRSRLFVAFSCSSVYLAVQLGFCE
jgi:hypothetical protein